MDPRWRFRASAAADPAASRRQLDGVSRHAWPMMGRHAGLDVLPSKRRRPARVTRRDGRASARSLALPEAIRSRQHRRVPRGPPAANGPRPRSPRERSSAAPEGRWRAIDALAANALDDARAADARRRARQAARSARRRAGVRQGDLRREGAAHHRLERRVGPAVSRRVERDALEVARLRAAGAIVLGKTAADDFAYHGNGTSSYTGQVLNPHDPTGTRRPGGSSAGSAVAVAGGMAFAALGTDDGGSNVSRRSSPAWSASSRPSGWCRAPG